MGPIRREQLQSPDPAERMAQEIDELVLKSRHLVAEMQEHVDRAKALTQQRRAMVRSMKERRRGRADS